MNTRSLSIASIGTIGGNRTNSALLYYENSSGNVSALLRRVPVSPSDDQDTDFQYVDVTHQSTALPDDFHNVGPSDTSYTLYESDTSVTFIAPFASQTNWSANVGALFYLTQDPSSEQYREGDFFEAVTYMIDPSGPGNFSTGMH